MRTLPVIGLVVLLLFLHVVVLMRTTDGKRALPTGEGLPLALPPIMLKITALEFDGLLSDYLFLETLTYYGGTLDRHEKPRIRDGEWRWFEMTFAAATVLDPYFLDPYLFGNSILTWEAGRIAGANELLDKGRRSREWDWRLPFLMGFNQFYFLQENGKAAEYLMEAARRKNDNPLLASLAAKLSFKERRTEASIQFLEEMVSRTTDEMVRVQFTIRIEALKNILFLEQAVGAYRKRFQRRPPSIDSLVKKGVISQVPKDPYGGSYFLSTKGEVKSTTESRLMPAIHKPTNK